MFVCKYCGQEFDNIYKMRGHIPFCDKNPNYENNLQKLAKNRQKIKHNFNKDICKCQYCGKEVKGRGCLVLHEKRCKQNPNYEPTEKQMAAEEKRKNKKPFRWTDEQKKNLSEKRKQWLNEHKNEHPWKRSTKFKSIPCEKFKEFLTSKNINFVDEYTPFNDYNFSIDIAFPEVKIGIEINGNQHYNSDGTLTEYYQNRHNILTERGWKIFEIHYSKCYNIDINNFDDILKLDIYDKDYVGKYFSNKELRKKKKEEKLKIIKQYKELQKQKRDEYKKYCKTLIQDMLDNSGIDFTKYGWVGKAKEYLQNKDSNFPKKTTSVIVYYFPNFYNDYNAFKRKF